jgi:hypothetical protein
MAVKGGWRRASTQAVSIVASLALTFQRIAAGALRLDNGERSVEAVEQNVVGKFMGGSV